jgi:hypothetical protein
MKELGLSLVDINNLSIKKIGEYLVIIDEINIIQQKQIDAAKK